MVRKLPEKRRRGVQREHTRRVKTKDGYKDVVVNRGVRRPKPVPRRVVEPVSPLRSSASSGPSLSSMKRLVEGRLVPRARSVAVQAGEWRSEHSALMWYYVGWARRFSGVSSDSKLELALELGRFLEGAPVHMMKTPDDNAQQVLDDIGIKRIRAGKDSWLVLDSDGMTIGSGSGLSLMALFGYLVDDLSGGQVADMPGYGWIKMGKVLL